jgi:hypothetical protein
MNSISFYLKKILIFLIPLYIIVLSYIVFDPFKVIYSYDTYYENNQFEFTVINRDMASFETFKKLNPIVKYNSFILGNSTSFYYRTNTWNKIIHSNQSMHINASNESLYGEYIKLKYFDENNIPITNAIIILDKSILNQVDPNKGILFMKHPEWNNTSKLAFHFEYLKAYFDRHFFLDFLKYKIFHYYNNTKQYHIWGYKTINNELDDVFTEQLIKKDSLNYYNNVKSLFIKKDNNEYVSTPIIGKAQELLLLKMANILNKKQTNFKIIITPHSDQIKISKSDLTKIEKIFKKKNVYDFSGKNWITTNIQNYYEPNHYKPYVADSILKIIYQ